MSPIAEEVGHLRAGGGTVQSKDNGGERMFLVIGAAGTCGGLVTRALAGQGARVRGLVRSAERAKAALAWGASEIAIGDLRESASIAKALVGIDGVFYVGPRFVPDEAAIGRALIEAARQAGVRKFVYQSVMHSCVAAMLHHEAKRQVEEELCRTEMEFTILQPARFMHNIVPNLNKIAASGVYTEPFSATAPISDVAYHDVAEVAALALTRSGYSGAFFELSADGMLNRHDRAALLSEVLGRPVRAAVQPIDEWLAGARMVDPYERSARKLMFEYYDRYGFRGGNGLILRCLLGRSPTSFRSFLQTSGIDPSIHTERPAE